MSDDFYKFPTTPHLATLPGVEIRGDKLFSHAERVEFLEHSLVIEEKMDGGNLGISFDSEGRLRLQNRGSYLPIPGPGQWKQINDWLQPRIEALFEHLTDQLLLFGEWCYALHSVYYDRLPDWFLGFDIYDRQADRFWSVARRDALFQSLGIAQVPRLATGRFCFAELSSLLTGSRYSDQPAEGLYLRYDDDRWLGQRAKLVRPGFVQAIDLHWARAPLRRNRLAGETSGERTGERTNDD